MNYSKVYDELIQFRQAHPIKKSKIQYCELHHILPRSLGGNDIQENIVNLTAREHYLAHRLLAKIMELKYGSESIENIKMQRALFLMARYKKFKKFITSRTYEKIRISYCNAVGKRMSIANKGRKMSNERKLQNKLDSSSRKWMMNKQLNESHFVKPADIQFYLNKGFVFGRLIDQTGDKNPIHNHIFTAEERRKRSINATISNRRRARNK